MEVGKYFCIFSWLDKFCSGIWAWCVYAIVDELGSFILIGFSDGSLVWTIFSGHPAIVLCIPSQILGHLHVVVVGIEYY